MSGFFVVHREWRDNPVFRGEYSRGEAWLWLIEKACWKPTKFDVNGKTITLDRGQLCASRSQLAKAWGWKESAVERFLTRLQTEQMIGRETGQGKSVITICNYRKYQDVYSETGQATGQATGQRSDSDRTAKEQGNKGTIVEEEPNGSPSTARTRAADAFPQPDFADADVWADFLRNRKAKRLPNTATAYRKFIKDIEALADPQWPPGRLLEAIVARGWGAAYDPRPKDYQNGNRNYQDAGGSAAGNRGSRVRTDGFTDAINAELARTGSLRPAEAAGRWDDGPTSGADELPLAAGRLLR